MESIISHLPRLVRASFESDMRTVENVTMTMIRKMRKEYPEIAEEIARAVSHHGVGAAITRSIGIDPPPKDRDTLMSLARVDEPDIDPPKIILSAEVDGLIERFIKERNLSDKLLASGIKPPTSLLLYGPPGVGKTLMSRYLSSRLSLPLITLDLASSISSYLGKTGQNLKKVLAYAKERPAIFLLDEFDAVAKRRDDPTDLGELKRIVNVLLKELEEWPIQSVLIAATNHPELLDRAIWRRFDRSIELLPPDEEARTLLWKHALGQHLSDQELPFLEVMASVSEGMSPADIERISQRVIRQIVIDDIDPIRVIIDELKEFRTIEHGKFNQVIIRAARSLLGSKISQRKIASWLGISPSTVSHHIKNDKG